MEDSSCDQALRGRGDAEGDQPQQRDNNSSEASVSPQNRERPQAPCEDTANKTIEFLRARLLAERATSKAAKEAAENNGKRLMELERMLEVETEQRKKAEEAMQEVMEKLRIVGLSSASASADSDRTGEGKHRIKEEREELEDARSSNSTSSGAIEESEEIVEANVTNNRQQEDGHSSASSVKSVEQGKDESIDFANNNVKAEDHGQNKGVIQDQMSSQRKNKDNGIVLSPPSLQNQEIHDQMSSQSKNKDSGIVLSSPTLKNQEIHDQISNQSKIKYNQSEIKEEESIDFANNNVKTEDDDQNKGFIQDQMSSQSEKKDNDIVLTSPLLQNQEIQNQMSSQSEIKDNCIVLSSPSLQNQEIHDHMSNHSEIRDNQSDIKEEESIDFAINNVKAEDHDQNKGFTKDQMSSQSENKDNGTVLSSPSLLNLDIQDQMQNQSEIKDDGMVLSSPSLQNQGIQDQMPKQSEIKDNCIVLSSPLPKNQNDYYASKDCGMCLNKYGLNEKGDAFQGPPAPESFTDRGVAMHPRLKIEEKITGLFDQMGNEVAPPAGQDQKEFLRLSLHELVDQIVSASEKEIHKYENSNLQTFNCSSKFPALENTCVQKTMNDRNYISRDFQSEVPCKGPNRIDSLEADKSSDSNSNFRILNERAAAPSMDMIRCKRHENEYGHAIHCCGTQGNLCKRQHSDFSHTFLPGKEDLCSHNLFQNAIAINISQRKAPDMQACLENKKADEMNCRSFSETHCDDCRKEVHYTMGCSVGTTTQNSLYHESMCVGRSCNHNQAAGCMELGNPLEFSRVSGSDGSNYIPKHHDFNSSHGTSYLSRASRIYQRKDILPNRAGPSSVRNCHNHLPLQLSDSCNDMPNSNKNVGHTKLYSDYNFSSLLSMQWSSRGTPLDDTEVPRFPRGKVGDALMALRHAKQQIQSSIETRQNLRTYIGMSSPNGQNPCRQLVLR